jgi:transposase
VGELIEANRRLEARVVELERRLNRNSRNSSLPPPQDPPSAPPRPGKSSSGRRPGGQAGHEGRNRRLLPPERGEEVVDHWPARCQACARPFTAEEQIDAASPQRHQVAELPPIAVRVSEHHLHRLRCPACAACTRAQLPAEVPQAPSAPPRSSRRHPHGQEPRLPPRQRRARPRVVRRRACERHDRRDRAAHRRGPGRAAGAARRASRSAAAVNIDETGWRLRGGKRTLWGALTERAAVFRIAPDRHEREARALLGEDFAGVACSDRWWAYNYLDPGRRQVCWSHVIRDFTAQSEGLEPEQSLGQAGLEIAGRLFQAWDDLQANGDRAQLLERVAPLRDELKPLLHRCAGKSPKYKRTRGLARNLLKVWPALWTFSELDLVEPTNNRAQRGLRSAVIYRKLSLGSQSEAGEHTIERLLSASQTCRLQHRSLFAYLTDVLTAKARGDPVLSLV